MTQDAKLRVFAEEIRLATLRLFEARGFGHVGGAMSVVEMIAVLYGGAMKIDSKNPGDPDRDMLVMSKGHAGPTLYAALALKGYFPEELLLTLNRPGTTLPSHCDRTKTPGIDMTTGSLGQGVSTAIGLAIGNRMDGRSSRVYLCVGDGECDEGQVWEGLMLASHRKLDNLTVFCDKNNQQLDGYVKNVLDTDSLADKFKAFGFYTQHVDGHDIAKVREAVENACSNKGKPSMIVLETKKGNGCTFAENQEFNHHIAFTGEQIKEALDAAEKRLESARAAAERE
jgi:transketolase